MDVDDRGHHAARALRAEVEADLDLDAAHARVLGGEVPRQSPSRTARAVMAVAAGIVVVGALVAVAAGSGRDAGDQVATGPDGLSARGAAIMGGLPTSAIDGKDSWRLPVVADPQTDLSDGTTVTVYGRGFEAHDYLGVVMCASEAETEGAGACELGTETDTYGFVTYANADAQGNVVATVEVRQTVTTPVTGPVDCASEAERCLIGLGAVENYDRSGGTYVNFAGAPPFPEPHLRVEPEGPLEPGADAFAVADGLVPHHLYEVQQCLDDLCLSLATGRPALDGTWATVVTPGSRLAAGDGTEVSCEGRCTLVLTGVGVDGASSVPFPDPVPLTFSAGDAPPVEATPPATGSSPQVVPAPDTAPPATLPPATSPPGTAPPATSGPTDPPQPSPGTPTAPPTTYPPPTVTATTAPR
ncbi:MAG: neocarzinostatin apoprotein domain-containing protein [Iamia sp.]